jgi:tetratricopeptide (TPR) repeat protein
VTPTLIALSLAQAAAAAPATPPATSSADNARFQACVAETRSAPERAVETANAWRVQGGGLDARQCQALAYVALGRWRSAATAFEQAAQDAEAAQDARRTMFRVQAGNAWLAADEGAKAIQSFDAALASAQLSGALRGEVHLDRGRALVALGRSGEARADFDRALELVPADPMAWYLSAALAARQQNLIRAAGDIARARQLAGDDPDVLLLAGTIAGLQGNGAEAERLYAQVAAAAPQSDAGRRAAAALASMRDVAPAAATPPAAAQNPPQQQPPR